MTHHTRTRSIVAMLLVAVVIGPTVHGRVVQTHDAAGTLLEAYERVVFWRQLEFARQLVALKDTRVLKRLEGRLADEDRHARANAAFVFAGLGDPRGLEVLAVILNDRSRRPEGQGVPGAGWSLDAQIRSDRYYAVHVLAETRHERAVDLLLPLMADADVNYKVAWALGELGSRRAVTALIRALGNSAALVRISAIQSLAKLRARDALPHLRALLGDSAMPSAGDQVSVADHAAAAVRELEREP